MSSSIWNAVGIGIWASTLDIIYPVHCVLCGEFGETYLCEQCAFDIPEDLDEPLCVRCGHSIKSTVCESCAENQPDYIASVSAGKYSGNLMEAIHWHKYRDRPMLAEPLGRVLASAAITNRSILNDLKFDLIIPVPMHWMRQRRRGYNHAERLARELGRIIGVDVDPNALKRARRTRAQVGMNADRRKANVFQAFRVVGNVNNKVVLIVDDVSTTGSTLRECAKELKHAGADSIYCITLAAG